ncbi:MAG: hypothetical protein Q4B79_07560 [Moraxella sp.]|uniref:hypothetical protein n=1 Tax=Moraxella sp. TaxID=479 RepID=UPI0026DCB89A|nr:hypothetical protein [Moraxella sp.]MDO4450795.1 hypothetical protein [Moraxella sp.]
MKKLLLPLLISGLLLACNNNQTPSQPENKSEIKTEPQVLKEVIPIQDENKTETTSKTDCNAISQTLKSINNESKFDEIESIERQLKECLPTVNNATQLQWANDYHKAYERFLGYWEEGQLNDETDGEVFYNIMTALAENKTQNPKELATLSKKMQYLIELSQDKKIVPTYLCEGLFEFRHQYQNFADLFTPHLPKDQAIFINQLAKDNQEIFWCDAGIAISLRELIERTLFWQDFIKKYPDSQFIDDAKYLYQFYEYYLFFGSENTHWLEDDKTAFIGHTEEGDDKTVEEHFIDLAKQDNALGKKAQAYLEFVATPVDEREQKYPLKPEEYPSEEYEEWRNIELARLQLHKALDILGNPTDGSADCFSAPMCLERQYD